MNKTTKVTLLTYTAYPIETIYIEWMASRTAGPVPLPGEVRERIELERHGGGIFESNMPKPIGPYEKEVRKVFEDVVSMKIPVAETIDFVFLLEHVSIALREQMVRHRIGHKFGGQLGADLIPDIGDSTWWSQTMRVLDMGHFATDEDYLVPETFHNKPGKNVYLEAMKTAEDAYTDLIALGWPPEDARNVLPLATQHRLTWKMNLSALMHVLSKRGCWIAQLGMWEPVIMGVVEELATKVDPYFRKLIDPPCIGADGNFKSCVFKLENENREKGEDPYPPCPLWFGRDKEDGEYMQFPRQTYSRVYGTALARVQKYAELWGRDPYTGERKQYA